MNKFLTKVLLKNRTETGNGFVTPMYAFRILQNEFPYWGVNENYLIGSGKIRSVVLIYKKLLKTIDRYFKYYEYVERHSLGMSFSEYDLSKKFLSILISQMNKILMYGVIKHKKFRFNRENKLERVFEIIYTAIKLYS
jgi:hypothetical protein